MVLLNELMTLICQETLGASRTKRPTFHSVSFTGGIMVMKVAILWGNYRDYRQKHETSLDTLSVGPLRSGAVITSHKEKKRNSASSLAPWCTQRRRGRKPHSNRFTSALWWCTGKNMNLTTPKTVLFAHPFQPRTWQKTEYAQKFSAVARLHSIGVDCYHVKLRLNVFQALIRGDYLPRAYHALRGGLPYAVSAYIKFRQGQSLLRSLSPERFYCCDQGRNRSKAEKAIRSLAAANTRRRQANANWLLSSTQRNRAENLIIVEFIAPMI